VRPAKLFEGQDLTPDSPAEPFEAVLHDLSLWLLETIGLGLDEVGRDAVFLTCGDWDCNHVHAQCDISGIRTPPAFCQWVNIKRTYSDIYGGDFRGMKSMLARLRLLDSRGNVKHGFHHLGMHDVENICRCLLHVLQEGNAVTVNGFRRS